MVGFVDFDKQTYSVASYQNNKLIALYGMKDTRSLFKDAFSGADKQLNPKMNGGCEETTSIAKSENGNDSTIVNAIKVHGGIECPGYRTFWQQLGDFFSGIWGNITDAFDWLFGSGCGGGGGSAGGWGNGGGYAGSGAFGGGGYIDWGFSGFVGSGSGGVGAYTGGGQQWGPYNPNFLDEADAYAQSLGYYWEDQSNDINNATSPPYDPTVDDPYNAQGYRKMGGVFNYSQGVVQNYTDDIGNYNSIFTRPNGTTVLFPGATITNLLVFNGYGWTSAWGRIHAALSFTLANLQHEYGHYLQAQIVGAYEYNKTIVPQSLYNAATDNANHPSFWTEKIANRLAVTLWPRFRYSKRSNKFPAIKNNK